MAERFCALDTDVLLSLQAGERMCVAAHQLLRQGGFIFRATPTIIRELERHRQRAETFIGALAENILASPKQLDLVLDGFDDTQRAVTSIHTNRIIERKIMGEGHSGDICTLIEAAYLDCMLFITKRQVLLSNRQNLTLSLLQDCGMASMVISAPEEIVHVFKLLAEA